MTKRLLVLQSCDRFLQRCDLLLRVALLLALESHNSLRSVSHELLVRELLLNACEESFEVLQLSLLLLYLCSNVNHIAKRHCELVCAYHEGSCGRVLLRYYVDS